MRTHHVHSDSGPRVSPWRRSSRRGEAEIGFQQVSELIHVPGVTYVGTIPAELQPGFSFAAAITSKAKEPDAAKALIRFLISPDAAPTITRAGLTPIPLR